MDQALALSRFKTAAALSDTGVRLMRQTIRRRHPGASEDEIDNLLTTWLHERPMDAPGRVLRPG